MTATLLHGFVTINRSALKVVMVCSNFYLQLLNFIMVYGQGLLPDHCALRRAREGLGRNGNNDGLFEQPCKAGSEFVGFLDNGPVHGMRAVSRRASEGLPDQVSIFGQFCLVGRVECIRRGRFDENPRLWLGPPEHNGADCERT